jgi:hypothetical protein
MNRLSFRKWLLDEMANYGFDGPTTSQILGGTDVMQGDDLFSKFDCSLVIDELTRMPAIGTSQALQIWDEVVQWGEDAGAVRVSASPLGSLRFVTRRLIADLNGEYTWICKKVNPIKDFDDQHEETKIASKMFEQVEEVMKEQLDIAVKNYEGLEKLAYKLWHGTKRQHPSYIMFPTNLRKQNENYYKLVFEFRGQGAGAPYNGKTGRAEQFNIDLVFYPEKGLIRCLGYDIDSSYRSRDFHLQPSEWDEAFSPKQESDVIVENIIKLFLQY